MGGVCSGGANQRQVNRGEKNGGLLGKLRSIRSRDSMQRQNSNQNLEPVPDDGRGKEQTHDTCGRGKYTCCESKRSATDKTLSNKKGLLLGRAGIVGLERAVEVLDTLGSSMSGLNTSSGFVSGAASRGKKMSILAFEVANTVTKGATLYFSLSEENMKSFKKEVLCSQGVIELVSTDMNELRRIAAADKRAELEIFANEVIRFGNLCKDPQWRNLDRYFARLNFDDSHPKQPNDDVESKMQELVSLAQRTSELYHELQALDGYEHDYQRKVKELEALNLPQKGESFTALQSELKQQRKIVRNLQKRSFWSRRLEEIMEILVDVVAYIQKAIMNAFGDTVSSATRKPGLDRGTLGEAGLALHYANIIQQIDSIASRPSYLPPNARDTLYEALPQYVRTALSSRLRSLYPSKELLGSNLKDELEKTLNWLAPLAANTTKAHQGFGWVGEWANTGSAYSIFTAKNSSITRLETLYHAEKKKMDILILELVVRLHLLISLLKEREQGHRHSASKSSADVRPEFHSTTQLSLSPDYGSRISRSTVLSLEDRFLLESVSKRKIVPRVCKSQEFVKKRSGNKPWLISRSTGRSPTRGSLAVVVSEHLRDDILDRVDGLDFSIRVREVKDRLM